MKNKCNEMRRAIEESIDDALDSNERDDLERHCTECVACRAYRERLLSDDTRLAAFAASGEESVRRVRERTNARVRAAADEERSAVTEPRTLRSSRPLGALPRIRRITVIVGAAAAVIVALFAIDFLRGARNGPVPAFAAVQEKMRKCENVRFRIRLWDKGRWITREEGRVSSGIYRRDYGDSITIHGYAERSPAVMVETTLFPAERRATVLRMKFPPYPAVENNPKYKPHDPVDGLASWYKAKGFNFVTTERLNGKNAAIYEKLLPSKPRETWRMTAWIDLETELPVRFEIVAPRSGPNDDVYPFDLRLGDFTADSSRTAGWIYPKPNEPIMIFDTFRWNVAPDPSYFSFTPPAGYDVETHEATLDSCLTEGESEARYFVVRLSRWLDESGNIFPDDLADLDDHAKVKQLLRAKYRRGGDPAEEFRAACDAARRMDEASAFLMLRCWTVSPSDAEERVEKHYVGKGVAFGDSRRVVCWFKDGSKPPCPGMSGNGPYFSIFADLHIEASSTPPELPGK